jgi:hypothetical protein
MKTEKNLGLETVLPAGSYFIGDLCYVMTNNMWDKWLNETAVYDADGKLDTYEDGFYDVYGHKVGWHGTAYGDGCYPATQNGNVSKSSSCAVDSGTIGIIPTHLVCSLFEGDVDMVTRMFTGDLGIVHRFDHEFTVELGVNSRFGHIVVRTSEDDSEFECEDYWEEIYD